VGAGHADAAPGLRAAHVNDGPFRFDAARPAAADRYGSAAIDDAAIGRSEREHADRRGAA